MTARIDLAEQHVGHAAHAGGTGARDLQCGIHAGIFKEAEFHGVRRVHEHDHMFEILFHGLEQVGFRALQFQIAFAGVPADQAFAGFAVCDAHVHRQVAAFATRTGEHDYGGVAVPLGAVHHVEHIGAFRVVDVVVAAVGGEHVPGACALRLLGVVVPQILVDAEAFGFERLLQRVVVGGARRGAGTGATVHQVHATVAEHVDFLGVERQCAVGVLEQGGAFSGDFLCQIACLLIGGLVAACADLLVEIQRGRNGVGISAERHVGDDHHHREQYRQYQTEDTESLRYGMEELPLHHHSLNMSV